MCVPRKSLILQDFWSRKLLGKIRRYKEEESVAIPYLALQVAIGVHIYLAVHDAFDVAVYLAIHAWCHRCCHISRYPRWHGVAILLSYLNLRMQVLLFIISHARLQCRAGTVHIELLHGCSAALSRRTYSCCISAVPCRHVAHTAAAKQKASAAGKSCCRKQASSCKVSSHKVSGSRVLFLWNFPCQASSLLLLYSNYSVRTQINSINTSAQHTYKCHCPKVKLSLYK